MFVLILAASAAFPPPSPSLSSTAAPICRAIVTAIDHGADPVGIAVALEQAHAYASDAERAFCAGYVSGVVDQRKRALGQ
jgi:hypothetical protein